MERENEYNNQIDPLGVIRELVGEDNIRANYSIGDDNVIVQAIEEFAELIQALTKLNRVGRGLTPKTKEAVMTNLNEEIADALLMLTMLQYIDGVDSTDDLIQIMRYKTCRGRRRLEGIGNEEK